MADWSKPNNNSTKSNFPTEIRNTVTNAIKMDPTGDSNLPAGAKRFNYTTHALEAWNGLIWEIVDGYPHFVPGVLGTNFFVTASAGTWTDTGSAMSILTVQTSNPLIQIHLVTGKLTGSLSTAAAEIYLENTAMVAVGTGRGIANDSKEASTFVDARSFVITTPIQGLAFLKKSGGNWAGSTALSIGFSGVVL